MRRRTKKPSSRNSNSRSSVNRLLCHVISVAITSVITVFATEGATAIWPTHPVTARIFAVACAVAACLGHLQFCAQFGVKEPTQSRVLLGFLIAIFAVVSVALSAVAGYQGLRNIQSTPLVVLFLSDFARGSPEAIVPFCIGCFLEILPVATLLLTVRRKPRVRLAG